MIGKKIPSILSEVDKWTANGMKFIYPVIVYLDDCFDVEGPCYLLNKEFQQIIGEKKVSPFNKYIFQEARKLGYELKKIRGFDEAFENLEMLDRKRL